MKVVRWIDQHLEEVAMVILLTAITLVLLLQIIMRYLFNNSLSWPEELCRYCFIWFMFIGFSYSTKADSNLRVDAVVNALPEKLSKATYFLSMLIGFAFTVFMFVNSYQTVMNAYRMKEFSVAMHLPVYFVHSAALIGFGLAAIRYLQRIVLKIIRKESESQEVGE